MLKEERQNMKKYLFWGIIIVLIISSYFIIQPYIVALITSFVLAFLVKPIYTRLQKKLNNTSSALICLGIITLIIFLPIVAITGGIIKESLTLLKDPTLLTNLDKISNFPLFSNLGINPEIIFPKVIEFFVSLITSAAFYIPSISLTILVILITTYYILIKWNDLATSLEEFIPFTNKKEVAKHLSDTTKTLMYGTVLVALIQGVIAAIGFSLFGIPGAFLIAAIIFFAAFIPGIGPIAAWGPVALYYLLTANYIKTTEVLIIGLIVSIGADTIIRNKILEKKSKIDPVIILVGLLGGIPLFGVFGFIIGPLILVYTLKLIEEAMHNE